MESPLFRSTLRTGHEQGRVSTCHPEQREGSVFDGAEKQILRAAQDDSYQDRVAPPFFKGRLGGISQPLFPRCRELQAPEISLIHPLAKGEVAAARTLVSKGPSCNTKLPCGEVSNE